MATNKLRERILNLMKQKPVSNADLAKELGIETSVIEGWENGLGRPLLTQIPAIAQVLDVSVDELVICSGEKKAVYLLAKYGSLSNLINNNQAMAELDCALPFLENQTIGDLYMIITEQFPNAYGIIVKLISHMNQHEIDEIANRAIENNKELLNKILPFVSENIIMKLMGNCDLYDFNNIQPYLPYINEKESEKIAAKFIAKHGVAEITKFTPYISNEFFDFINK